MEQIITKYTPVEIRKPVSQPPARASVTRIIRVTRAVDRAPAPIQGTTGFRAHTAFVWSCYQKVKIRGLRFKVRRLTWDEGFLRHSIEREDYTKIPYDIGANIDAFAVYASKQVPLGRVIAFEPASDNYNLLAHNTTLNGLNNLTPVRAAVAARTGNYPLLRNIWCA